MKIVIVSPNQNNTRATIFSYIKMVKVSVQSQIVVHLLLEKNTTNLATHLTKLHGQSKEVEEYKRLLKQYEILKSAKKRKRTVPSDLPKSKQLRLDEV